MASVSLFLGRTFSTVCDFLRRIFVPRLDTNRNFDYLARFMFSIEFSFPIISTLHNRNELIPPRASDSHLRIIFLNRRHFTILSSTGFSRLPSVLLQMCKLTLHSQQPKSDVSLQIFLINMFFAIMAVSFSWWNIASRYLVLCENFYHPILMKISLITKLWIFASGIPFLASCGCSGLHFRWS